MKITCLYRITLNTALLVCLVNATDAQNTVGPPVETKAPNSAYKPAFAGQTRIGSVKTTTPYKTDKLAEKLSSPWAIVPMPDGRLLITLKGGSMEIRNADGSLAKAITGLPAVEARGQGGLLDVALDPEFAKNKIIYWSFSEKYDPGNLTAVAKGKLDESKGVVENPTVIFRATPALKSSLHFGSRLAFGKDGYLYVSTGERSNLDGRVLAPQLHAGQGKIFRITKEGKAAPGNPFEKKAGAMPEIYAYGFRNPQGLVFDPYTNELWETEFGPRGGDELNLIKPGKDYGWPEITYGIEYSGEAVGKGIQQKEGLEQPVYYWDPVISPSGICFYQGDAIPEWKGNLFISGLSSTQLTRLVIKDNKVVGEERLLEDKKERIRDVACYNQMLYVVTDSGTLYRISRQ
ncbi:PQQ-dependent sugar dehydrogenase [Paraflavitalea soli]|uniref:PQQ-dependent sugar dehydrogenase n=1 Tax=Paraflavitalea soli TaxID=2315862 RepID=A0A3B7MVQ5_9BACT|nr:PQQ-dependent sugar dehydrogenase [Paraflavitalea soli]AXY78027.1 PQQ-dependent sugar dehydrogenase [Paraflavitalea soli]